MEELTKEQKEELEKFGANTWFVEYLFKQYQENPSNVPEQWGKFFGNVNGEKTNETHSKNNAAPAPDLNYPQPSEDDETKVIAGSSARILENMTTSLSIPVATSQRTIPVKLLEENRIILNR